MFLCPGMNQVRRPASCAADRRPGYCVTPAELERGWSDVIRCNEGDALCFRNGGRQRIEERCSCSVDFPTNQHGVVFVNGVVAVLHVHSTPVTELHGQGHASTRPQAVHVFTTLFPSRHIGCAAVTGKDLTFFKVNVNRVIPSTTSILQGPDFTSAELRRRGNTAKAGIQGLSTIHSNAPRPRLPASSGSECCRIICGKRL